ncbi:MAG: DUF4249 domain-containing protein [Cytophagaceae bacterium]|nr:MAG: DUF4249 domain-containing protein [Cytophagaceae bacterium]
MKTISYTALIVTLLALLGCSSLVQEVDTDNLPTVTPKMVVHCFISPQDTVLAVYVQAPRAILGTNFTDNGGFFPTYSIQGSIVELSDGTKTVRLPGVGGMIPLYYGIDARQFPIVAGRTYTLTVSNAYLSTITAQCTVPQQVIPTELRIDSLTRTQFGNPQTTYIGRLVWQDPAGQANYYTISGQDTKTSRYTTNGPQLNSMTNDLSFSSLPLVSDQGRDEQQFISPKAERTLYFNPYEEIESLRFTMTLSNIDENYYRYRETVDRQGDADENPFAEPVLVPSNIKGGYGCFGAYNQSTLTVKVR